MKVLQRQICIECVERRLGYHEEFTIEEKLAKTKELMRKHKECLSYGMCDLLDQLDLVAWFYRPFATFLPNATHIKRSFMVRPALC